MPPVPAEPHSEIATRLSIRLAIVFAISGFCTLILLPWPSVLSIPLVLVVNLFALWFTVHYAFAALDELLEAKLATLDRRARSGEEKP